MLDFRLCDLRGRTLSEIEDLPGSQVVLGLNDKRTASTTLSFEDPAVGKLSPLNTVIKARLRGTPLISGVALRPSFKGRERKVTVPVIDPSIRLIAGFLGQRSDGAGLLGSTSGLWRWDQLDQSEMLARLIDHIRPTAAEVASGIPDVGIARGNLPTSVNRDREYEPGKQVWEAFLQLAAVLNGVDFEFDAVDQEDGTLALLNTYYPYQGTDRRDTVEFHCGWGRNNVSDYTWDQAGDLVKNRSTWAGQKPEDGSPQPVSTQNSVESQKSFGIYGEYAGASDVTLASTLTEQATATIVTYGYPINFIELRPTLDDGEGWYRDAGNVLRKLPRKLGVAPRFGKDGDYYLGDIVRVVIRDGYVDLDLAMRVMGATVTRLSNGGVLVEPKLAPIIAGAYRVGGVQPPNLARELAFLRQRLRTVEVIQ